MPLGGFRSPYRTCRDLMDVLADHGVALEDAGREVVDRKTHKAYPEANLVRRNPTNREVIASLPVEHADWNPVTQQLLNSISRVFDIPVKAFEGCGLNPFTDFKG